MEKPIYFAKVQFDEVLYWSISSRVLLNIPQKELSYQNFDIRRDEIVKSYGIRLSDEDIQKILPYCNALEFEKYRNKEMSTSDEGYIGYMDEVTMYFTAITDSYIPKIELPMEYYYDRAHEWPSERLYRFLVENYLDGNKIEELKGWGPNWGGFSLFWRPF